MNDEIKKYVNAYMDGEEVQWRYEEAKAVSIWHTISKLSYFEMPGAYINFRIKPKAEDKWQRVKDEEYLCKFWNPESRPNDYDYGKLTEYAPADASKYPNNHPFTRDDKQWYKNYEVLREKGIKQPYFQSDDIPEIDGDAVLYLKDGTTRMVIGSWVSYTGIDWSEVVAYIEV